MATLETAIGDIAKFAGEAIKAFETGSDTIALPNGDITVSHVDGGPAKFSLLSALLAVYEYETTHEVDIITGSTEISYIPHLPPKQEAAVA